MRYQQFASHAYFGAAGPVSKMASQQEKAFCVLRFEVSRSVITVQREFRARFRIDTVWNIWRRKESLSAAGIGTPDLLAPILIAISTKLDRLSALDVKQDFLVRLDVFIINYYYYTLFVDYKPVCCCIHRNAVTL